jgi:hypothetical protein
VLPSIEQQLQRQLHIENLSPPQRYRHLTNSYKNALAELPTASRTRDNYKIAKIVTEYQKKMDALNYSDPRYNTLIETAFCFLNPSNSPAYQQVKREISKGYTRIGVNLNHRRFLGPIPYWQYHSLRATLPYWVVTECHETESESPEKIRKKLRALVPKEISDSAVDELKIQVLNFLKSLEIRDLDLKQPDDWLGNSSARRKTIRDYQKQARGHESIILGMKLLSLASDLKKIERYQENFVDFFQEVLKTPSFLNPVDTHSIFEALLSQWTDLEFKDVQGQIIRLLPIYFQQGNFEKNQALLAMFPPVFKSAYAEGGQTWHDVIETLMAAGVHKEENGIFREDIPNLTLAFGSGPNSDMFRGRAARIFLRELKPFLSSDRNIIDLENSLTYLRYASYLQALIDSPNDITPDEKRDAHVVIKNVVLDFIDHGQFKNASFQKALLCRDHVDAIYTARSTKMKDRDITAFLNPVEEFLAMQSSKAR